VESALSFVSTRIPTDTHDRLIKLANQREQSVSALLRALVVFQLHPEKR